MPVRVWSIHWPMACIYTSMTEYMANRQVQSALLAAAHIITKGTHCFHHPGLRTVTTKHLDCMAKPNQQVLLALDSDVARVCMAW